MNLQIAIISVYGIRHVAIHFLENTPDDNLNTEVTWINLFQVYSRLEIKKSSNLYLRGTL